MFLKIFKVLEALIRARPSTYYFARKLAFWFVWALGISHSRSFNILRHISKRQGVILDIGANDGISVLSIRAIDRINPILALEPNPIHEKQLRLTAKLIKNFSYKIVATGVSSSKKDLHTPVYKNLPLSAFSSFIKPYLYEDIGASLLRTT